jgi:hypothetical protein
MHVRRRRAAKPSIGAWNVGPRLCNRSLGGRVDFGSIENAQLGMPDVPGAEGLTREKLQPARSEMGGQIELSWS